MKCSECGGERLAKHGKDRNGNQRYRCRDCKKTTVDTGVRPLGDMRIEMDKAVFALNLLLEGMSIRAVERMTNLHRDTICSLVSTVGANCQKFLDNRMQNIPAKDVQCDEIWGFVGAKEKNARRLNHDPLNGDAYTFIAIERKTKLVYCYMIGKRNSDSTDAFIEQLDGATSGHFQLSTDGFHPYRTAVYSHLNGRVDHGVLVKKYGNDPNGDGPRRYSPAAIIGIERTAALGRPMKSKVCTSHIERSNLTLRMQCRRMTRLTNGFSKTWEQHDAMLAIYFAWYNFVRKHSTIKTTPAVAHKLESEQWSMERLLTEAAKATHS
ncbi:IS1 family transposase [Stratiformator vulcanicus]|uniref:IS1 family transposase n=1 Tax=Stratiformator vulcanicus TaxID=2527980 RepID=UPI002877D879|nr:IS1 family transposase [Stratiformator vulcanicus]